MEIRLFREYDLWYDAVVRQCYSRRASYNYEITLPRRTWTSHIVCTTRETCDALRKLWETWFENHFDSILPIMPLYALSVQKLNTYRICIDFYPSPITIICKSQIIISFQLLMQFFAFVKLGFFEINEISNFRVASCCRITKETFILLTYHLVLVLRLYHYFVI